MQIDASEFSWQLSNNLVNECSANLYHTGSKWAISGDASVAISSIRQILYSVLHFLSILNTPLSKTVQCFVCCDEGAIWFDCVKKTDDGNEIGSLY